MSKITFQSSDGEKFEVDIEVAKMSNTIKIMLDECGIEAGDGAILPVPQVNADILNRVLKWSEHHKGETIPTDADDDNGASNNPISEWDTEFLKIDQGTLFELIMAANYLDIKGLMDVTCTTVANMMKGKTPEEIRKTFNIINDLPEVPTEQEAAQN
ncbi:S-phase kinase-associated protein 1-like [Contarinia nasturtii]|uniref:S-phase kinase-associated protein 1-like n=1 Tax=Contarinia nasturtii TaxID=265458 RepID=UPI0012D4119F|nr:S-phase kinase-associated protein 1-like [Contarinia nasturtii]